LNASTVTLILRVTERGKFIANKQSLRWAVRFTVFNHVVKIKLSTHSPLFTYHRYPQHPIIDTQTRHSTQTLLLPVPFHIFENVQKCSTRRKLRRNSLNLINRRHLIVNHLWRIAVYWFKNWRIPFEFYADFLRVFESLCGSSKIKLPNPLPPLWRKLISWQGQTKFFLWTSAGKAARGDIKNVSPRMGCQQ
jgi:hypothetical protein